MLVMKSEINQITMSFGDHLEELRIRVLYSLLAPIILFFPGMLFGKPILRWLTLPVLDAMRAEGLPPRLQTLAPIEAFVAYLKVAFLLAILCSAPVIIWQIWKFIAPGLYNYERRVVYLLIPMSVILTASGVFFLYYIIMPLTLQMLIRFGNRMDLVAVPALIEEGDTPAAEDVTADNRENTISTENSDNNNVLKKLLPLVDVPRLDHLPANFQPGEIFYHTKLKQLILKLDDNQPLVVIDTRPINTSFTQEYRLKDYLSFIFSLMLAFGLAFQLPLVILLLGWVGLVTVTQLQKGRKYAILGVFVVGAILTPPDVLSQVSLAIPLYLLYEGSIILLKYLPFNRLVQSGSIGED